MRLLLIYLLLVCAQSNKLLAQPARQPVVFSGKVMYSGAPVAGARVYYRGAVFGTTDSTGIFSIQLYPETTAFRIQIQAEGYFSESVLLTADSAKKQMLVQLNPVFSELDPVVVSGTMKEVTKASSAVPVDVFGASFFRSNPSAGIFESMQMVNGVRPQINCNVCNTGDIHINGMEGPYTMVLIDGMPVVSGLATVYGLFGIPQSLIERVEVVKGPASTLYGSEAVGGLINVITRRPEQASAFSADIFTSSWLETSADLGVKFRAGRKADVLTGINVFHYDLPRDDNEDGFTDLTLQKRVALFSRVSFQRKKDAKFNIAGRYVAEERWGGQMNWTPEFRGGDSIYGEQISTRRWELMGVYQLPVREKINLMFSANNHLQQSAYGTNIFNASQFVGFGQLIWNKSLGNHDLLTGLTLRHTFYDDNTPATAEGDSLNLLNNPSAVTLPGIFLQDEWKFSRSWLILSGLRYDRHPIHGSIFTPRLNAKWTSKDKNLNMRLGTGNGYRVANVFTEDHAALTGARKLEFTESLKPETSWNVNLNGTYSHITKKRRWLFFDAGLFYTHFANRILPDYETDPNKIIYGNLSGYSVSRGMNFNFELSSGKWLKMRTGFTLLDVFVNDNGQKWRPYFTERYSAVWGITVTHPKNKIRIDYTGNLYGPMKLPLLSDLDLRPGYSPVWSIQNIQISKRFKSGVELYGGVKNLLNFKPPANSISRPFDPFDKKVQFDANGQVIPTSDNPQALTFDPGYVFAPNQGIRIFIGLRFLFN